MAKNMSFVGILVAKFLLKNLSPYFSIGFWHVAKNVKETETFLLLYPVHSQTWLNFIMDDRQFSYITNMREKNPAQC
jgi:hypothetical protein